MVLASLAFQFRHLYLRQQQPRWLDMLAHNDQSLREVLHYPTYQFLLTEKLERNLTQSWQVFSELLLEHRCTKFFEAVDSELPNWELNKLKNYVYNKNVVRKDNFLNDQFKKIAKTKKSNGDPNPDNITEDDKKEAHVNFELALRLTLESEQRMADSMTIVRIFGHCFYSKDKVKRNDKLQDIYHRYNRKMVPFLSKELPQFDMNDYVFDTIPGKPDYHPGDDILDYYYNSISDSGIVISGSSRYVREIVKFIHVLRAMGNKLPIQIMFRADLLMRARQSIASAAYSSKEDLLGLELSNHRTLKKMIPDFSLEHDEIKNREFPVQDVTFINMQRSLLKLSKMDFGSYNNKIVALFFSSFENVLLFDADTVPLVTPDHFLKVKEFSESGAYFFRDRSLRDSNDWIETNFFAKLMPHATSKMDIAMGVKPVTDHTMANSYMTGWRHHQEAGLVVFNKKKHYASLFVLFALAIWGEPIKSLTWGDKELYWLAMSIAGDEDYVFNKFGAAGIGEITHDKRFQRYNNTLASEVCSSHPGHVSSEGKLLWINSGFSYCKKNGFSRDQLQFPYKLMGGREALLKLYEEPLKIRLAIVPPELPTLRPVHSPPDLTEEIQALVAFQRRKADVDQLDKVDQISTYNPQKGWVKSSCCQNYFYCAYNAVESFTTPGELDISGHVFNFSPEEAKEYDFLGTIWTSGLKQVIEYKHKEPKFKPPPVESLEEPKQEEPKQEELKQEEPKKEEPKKEEPLQEMPKLEEVVSESNVEKAPADSNAQGQNDASAQKDTPKDSKLDQKDSSSAQNPQSNPDAAGPDESKKTDQEKTERAKPDDATQLLGKSGEVISEPDWLTKQKEEAKKLLEEQKKEEAKQQQADIYQKEDLDELDLTKVRERPEHLKNNAKDLVDQLKQKNKEKNSKESSKSDTQGTAP